MMKKIVISFLTMLSFLLSMVVTPVFASTIPSNNVTQNNGIGKTNIGTIPLPNYVKLLSGTYTYSGKVLISYKTEKDINITDYYNIAVLNDDGTDFKTIFSGVIPTKAKSNGIRYMPFQDNKRVLLGDYVLECTPNIDNFTSTKVVPVVFPSKIAQDPNTSTRWSEIIIAPDNKHMSWTTLRSDIGSIACIGTLDRKADSYVIDTPQIISTVPYFKTSTTDPSSNYIIPNPLRVGEVKQFVQGGNAISAVGQQLYSTTDSIVQDLKSDKITQITYTPGYDETTIFSPDEQLGMVMSTRFSKNTDPAIFGLMPRPYGGYTSMGLNSILYTYAVTGVRKSRNGNIGPVLININSSMNDKGYQGILLNTDENWFYRSPMSWNPNGKSAMWVEGFRGDDSQRRLQKVNLLDYKPQKTVPIQTTTDNIPYGQDLSVLDSVNPNINGKIAGKYSGYINYDHEVSSANSGKTESQYVNYSDDGVNFYNGYEKLNYNYGSESCYEANIKLTGKQPGEMNLKATFSALGGNLPAKLLFDTDADGNPKSYGYVTYNGVTLNIKDLSQ